LPALQVRHDDDVHDPESDACDEQGEFDGWNARSKETPVRSQPIRYASKDLCTRDVLACDCALFGHCNVVVNTKAHAVATSSTSTGNLFELQDHGPATLKDIAAPTRASVNTGSNV
jgi:hypothetical protein